MIRIDQYVSGMIFFQAYYACVAFQLDYLDTQYILYFNGTLVVISLLIRKNMNTDVGHLAPKTAICMLKILFFVNVSCV